MKTFLVLFLLVLSVNLQADWHDLWVQAIEMCHDKNFNEAEHLFSCCINEVESQNDEKGMRVYVDRDSLYLLQERYEEALFDLNKAICHPSLSKRDLTRALVSRICASSNLGITEGILEDLSLFRKSLPEPPEMEFTKNYIIIRNVPNSECFKDIVSNYFVKARYCKSVSEIKMFESGNWVVERTENSLKDFKEDKNRESTNPCSILKEAELKPSNLSLGELPGDSLELGYQDTIRILESTKGLFSSFSSTIIHSQTNDSDIRFAMKASLDEKPQTCYEWCDYFAIAGSAWCAKVFKRYDCQVGCLAAVEMIKRHLCYRCCRDGNFYKTCIKPFEDILSHMDIAKCDPYWD